VDAFLGDGHRVRVLDDLFSGCLENLQAVQRSIALLREDIRDPELQAPGTPDPRSVKPGLG
jgi:hypothetical protein